MLVAIDGPAGAGKSTVARALAPRLGFTYLDSGAMYRCVALLALASPGGRPGRARASARTSSWAPRVLLDGRDVTDAIRAPEVSEAASRVAADPAVRERAGGQAARDDRDTATGSRRVETSAPSSPPRRELKIFLTADPRERARRRASELGADPEAVLAEQTLRDERDCTREHSPLAPAIRVRDRRYDRAGRGEVVDRIAGLLAR